MPGRTSRQKQQRILFAHRVRFFHFAKQILGITELPFNLLSYFRSNVVAASEDSRADRSFDILRQCAEPEAHFSHALFDNALDRAAPTRVEHSHGSLLGVDEDDWQTISRLNAEQNARHAGN